MSPTYHDLVYGHPTEILAHTMEGEGWGPKTLVANQTVKVFGEEKMMWRGEFFLTTGKLDVPLIRALDNTVTLMICPLQISAFSLFENERGRVFWIIKS